MKIICIIQARLNSTRLPGKVLMPLGNGKPMLWHVVERAKRAKMLNDVVVAYPLKDREISYMVAETTLANLYPWNENENDLIGRYYHAAYAYEADIIVRLCADNPMVEPSEIDRAVEYFLEQPRIFVSNMHDHHYGKYEPLRISDIKGNLIYEYPMSCGNCYPDGIGCEVFSISTLKWLHESVKDPILREHLHKFFHDYSMVESPMCPKEFARPDLRLCVDTKEDYEYVSDIFNALYPKNPNFTVVDVIKYLDDKKCQDE